MAAPATRGDQINPAAHAASSADSISGFALSSALMIARKKAWCSRSFVTGGQAAASDGHVPLEQVDALFNVGSQLEAARGEWASDTPVPRHHVTEQEVSHRLHSFGLPDLAHSVLPRRVARRAWVAHGKGQVYGHSYIAVTRRLVVGL